MLPSKDIGSIGPPGLRIWLKITCDMCKNVSRRRIVQARRLLRDSRRARVSCEGNDFRVTIEGDSEFGKRQNA